MSQNTEERKRTPRHIELGHEYGLLKPGYCLRDYCEEGAISNDGYETIVVDGVQRSGKSNLSLQIGSWCKEATLRVERGDKWLSPGWDNPAEVDEVKVWEMVLSSIVYTPSDFVNTLEKVPEDETLDVLIWDDLNASYTNQSFRIDPEQYAAIDSTFTVVGTACRVIVANIPVINRLARNIKDNATFEIFVGKNKKRKIMRIFRLPGVRDIRMNLFKPDVELPSKFDIYKIPPWAWERYEKQRRTLARKVLGNLKEHTDMETLPGYIPIIEAARICKQHGVNWGISTLQQNVSRGVLVGQRVGRRLCVEEKVLLEALGVETMDAETTPNTHTAV